MEMSRVFFRGPRIPRSMIVCWRQRVETKALGPLAGVPAGRQLSADDVFPPRLDANGNRFSQLLHSRPPHAPSPAIPELLRLDLVPAADELCRDRAAAWRVHSPHAAHDAPDSAPGLSRAATREADMAPPRSIVSGRDCGNPGTAYQLRICR